MLIKLTHDVYEISKRIKQIDRDYYVVYNTSTCKFEVHNLAQQDTTYCLTLPYSFLDERTLNYVAKTRSVNIETILEELEIENKNKESEDKSATLNQMCESVENNFKEKYESYWNYET